MQIIPLYKYERTEGGTTVSPVKPESKYTDMYRLIADEGKALTNGEIITPCIDVESVEGWSEIDEPKDEPNEQEEI